MEVAEAHIRTPIFEIIPTTVGKSQAWIGSRKTNIGSTPDEAAINSTSIYNIPAGKIASTVIRVKGAIKFTRRNQDFLNDAQSYD